MNICACLGNLNGDPFCPCQMISKGLVKEDHYAWTDAEKEEFYAALMEYEPEENV